MHLEFSERRMGKGNPWLDEEVKALINIWAETNIQEQLDGAVRNKAVFQRISKCLNKVGYDKDRKQSRAKIKNLKTLYKRVKDKNNRSGKGRKVCNFFEKLGAFSARDLLLNHP